jgi:hypothetical protein
MVEDVVEAAMVETNYKFKVKVEAEVDPTVIIARNMTTLAPTSQ